MITAGDGIKAHQDTGHVREAFKGLADIGEACFVQQDLLQDEGGHCLGELAARLHNAKAEWDDLRRQ